MSTTTKNRPIVHDKPRDEIVYDTRRRRALARRTRQVSLRAYRDSGLTASQARARGLLS